MDDGRERRAKAIFDGAYSLSGREREAYLNDECKGDAELRARVNELLAGEPTTARFLADVSLRAAERPGTMIGPYKLLQLIGEGGFGDVYQAEQQSPVNRLVALKVIKLGMDTRQVVARFEQERQALAMMDHPNIARVLDAGATLTGRPYFVMDLVKGGSPITAYCDREKLSLADRLDLFEVVCGAAQHAHNKGIIHRDIKPSNILVAMKDGRPCVKVIDFGVAKATRDKLTDKTLVTVDKQMIGTTEYMSPEQAEGSLDVDTRTDVYSLGVLLYELLTGTTPFADRDLGSRGYEEVMRIIREVNPEAPSKRVRGSRGTVRDVADRRCSEPANLLSSLHPDLDKIVLMALAKERNRRYETPRALLDDVQRFRLGLPVIAVKSSKLYIAKKFVRRHKAIVLASSLMLFAFVVGLPITAWGWREAAVEAKRARVAESMALAAEAEKGRFADSERAARRVADRNAESEAKARARAEKVNAFVARAFRTIDMRSGGRQDTTIAEAMTNALKRIDDGEFTDDRETEATLRGQIGSILVNNGRAAEAESTLTMAIFKQCETDPGVSQRLADMLCDLGIARKQLGQLQRAEELHVESLRIQRIVFCGDHEDIADNLNNLAIIRLELGRPGECEPLLSESLEMQRRLLGSEHAKIAGTLRNLARTRLALGKPEEAERLFKSSNAMQRRLVNKDSPMLAEGYNNLAVAQLAMGRDDLAEISCRQALGMYRRLFKGDHPDIASCLINLGVAQENLGAVQKAEDLYAEAFEMQQRLLLWDHPEVARCLLCLASARKAMGKIEESEPLISEALSMQRRLHVGDHSDIANSLGKLALIKAALGRPAEAEPIYAEALAMRRRIFDGDNPEVAVSLANLATAWISLDRLSEAEAALTAALVMIRRVYAGDNPDIAFIVSSLALAHQTMGREIEARQEYREAIAMYRRLSAHGSGDLAETLWRSGQVIWRLEGPRAALPELEEALRMGTRYLRPGHPQLVDYRAALEECRAALDRAQTQR